MKRSIILLVAIAAVSILNTSCGPSQKRGAVVGGLVGAGAGALIGEHKDRELEGAGIGAAIGAGVGSLLGGARDDERGYYNAPPRRNNSYYNNSRY